MANQTRSTRGGSPLGRLLALGVTFAVGYVLGSRSGGSDAWEGAKSEPTEITIDDGEETEESESESE